MKKRLYELLFLFIALAMVFCGPISLSAQEADIDEFTLEEVVVTAEKREMELQKVSSSMAVITAEELDIRSTQNVQEILANTAGLSFYGFHNQIYIRGIGATGLEVGSEPSVQFNVDGNVFFNLEGRTTNPMLQATNDVERIEVIRGPSGTVNGRMASAGTINVISKSPDFEILDGNVKITYGNYDTIRTEAAMNFPLKRTGLELPSFLENLSFRFAASEDKHEGYIHNELDQAVSGMQNYFTVRGRVKWQPIESLTVDAIYNYTRDASNQGMGVPPVDHDVQGVGPMRTSKAHPHDPWLSEGGREMGEGRSNEQYNEAVQITWDTRFGALTGRYGHSWVPVECDAAQEGINCWSGDMGQEDYEIYMQSPDDSRINWMVGAYTFHKVEFTGPEQQLGQINPDIRINWQEFYGNDDKFPEKDWFDPGLPVQGSGWDMNDTTAPWHDAYTPYLDPVVPGEVAIFMAESATRPIDHYSVYGNVSIPFFEDRHRLVLGLRKNVEEKKRVMSVGVFGPDDSYGGYPHFTFEYNTMGDTTRGTWWCDNCSLLDAQDPQEISTSDNPLTYTLGWEYDLNPDVMLYLMVKNGFKPGGISPMSTPAVEYKPETTTNYAIGMKGRFFDDKLQLNYEAFYTDLKDFQMNIASQGSLTRIINGVAYTQPFKYNMETRNFAPMAPYGVDLDYDWLITPKDRLRGNMEFKHGEYSDLRVYLGETQFPPGAPKWTDYGGRTMAFSPKFTFYGSYTHMFNFGNYLITPQFDARFSSKYFAFYEYWWDTVNPEMWQPSFWKFDAYVNISPQVGKWNFSAYVKNISEAVIRNSAFFMGINIGDPRTFGASLKIRF